MNVYHQPTRERATGAVIALVLQVAFCVLLIRALGVSFPPAVRDDLKVFGLAPKPPPPPREELRPEEKPSKKASGKASPANLEAKRTETVAPPPVVPLPVPPPVAVAPIAGLGTAPIQGATNVRGPGSGAGGQGNGTGSGGDGDGEGDGGIPPRQIKGRIKDSDYPRDAVLAHAGGTVSVKYKVGTDGRASDCTITHSSGSTALDATTCRLIVERFRFKPSRDETGVPVDSYIVEDHSWNISEAPPEGDGKQ